MDISHDEAGCDEQQGSGGYDYVATLERAAAGKSDEGIGKDIDGGGVEEHVYQCSHISSLGTEAEDYLKHVVQGEKEQRSHDKPSHLLVFATGVKLVKPREEQNKRQS